MKRRRDWAVDRFHVTFAIIAAGWIAVSYGLQSRLVRELAENERLRTICAVAPE